MSENKDQNLIEVLRERKAAGADDEAKPREILDEWRKTVSGLLDDVESWLRDAEGEDLLTLDRTAVTLNEASLGTYDLEQLAIRFAGGDVAVVRPVAQMVIGAKGRVDVIAGPRRETLVRGENNWSIARRDPRLSLEPLDKPSFDALLLELISSPE